MVSTNQSFRGQVFLQFHLVFHHRLNIPVEANKVIFGIGDVLEGLLGREICPVGRARLGHLGRQPIIHDNNVGDDCLVDIWFDKTE